VGFWHKDVKVSDALKHAGLLVCLEMIVFWSGLIFYWICLFIY